MTERERHHHETDETDGEQETGTSSSRVRPWQIVMSTLAAGFGVQSSRNRERDFKQGKAGTFIAAGLIFTLLFIAVVATIVKLVLSSAG